LFGPSNTPLHVITHSKNPETAPLQAHVYKIRYSVFYIHELVVDVCLTRLYGLPFLVRASVYLFWRLIGYNTYMADKPAPSSSFAPFFILIVVIIAMWAFGGGANLSTTQNVSNNDSGYKPPTNVKEIESEVVRINEETKEIRSNIERNKLIGPLSSLYEKINLDGGYANATTPRDEYLQMFVSYDAPNSTQISGFDIVSLATGRGATIPYGVYRLIPSKNNVQELINVAPGDTVYINTGVSPIGFSFRVNKCMGYLPQAENFTPHLSTDCPAPRNEPHPQVEPQYRTACLDYIDNLSSCYVPTLTQQIIEDIGPTCAKYVANLFNYTSCFINHQHDPGFYKNEWRVFLNRPNELWDATHEFIKLLDLNKKTIDYIEY